jgi:NAD(P)-dependent dehydrogenase (short-subunit alcohol dehydrogenase family)
VTQQGAGPRAALDAIFDVRGTGVLITGAGGGLGLAIAEGLARCGARVTLVDNDAEKLDAAAAWLRAAGLVTRTCVADITNPAAVDRAMAVAAALPGGLQTVFANAGISSGPGPGTKTGRIDMVDPAAWDRVAAVNLDGVLATIQAAARNLPRDGRGRIVVTASVAGLRTEPMVGYAYAATKAAALALVRQAAVELAQYDIRINAIAPGPFATDIGGGRIQEQEVHDSFASRSTLKRIGQPKEIQGLALLLASSASSYINGATFVIDGGAT